MDVLSILAASLLVAELAVQGGYTAEKHPQLGMAFTRARDYEAVPVRPSEKWIVLFYAEKEAFREGNRKRFRPELRIVWIDHAGGTEAPVESIDTFEEYMAAEWPIWELTRPRALEERSGNRVTEHVVKTRQSDELSGWACTFSDAERTVAVLGFCATEDREEQLRIWRTMFGKIKFHAPEQADIEGIRRAYERDGYGHIDYRIRVHSRLVAGWKAEDTENFIVVYDTKDEPLIRLIKTELEAIRKEYVKLFPAAREIDAVSTVRVCKDEQEYLKYGGFPGSAGYWSAANEELVFYDSENVDGKAGSAKANARIVLYHEAFHQYIYYAVGKLAPHSWFNEGTGDFFSGAVFSGGKVAKIGLNPWRIDLIRESLEQQGTAPIPFHRILRMEQSEFYERSVVHLAYAQAWSMIYFLRTSRAVAKHPTWSGILDAYFDALKTEYAQRIEQQAATNPKPDEETLAKVEQAARLAAVEHAFSDVDLTDLEAAWREFVFDL